MSVCLSISQNKMSLLKAILSSSSHQTLELKLKFQSINFRGTKIEFYSIVNPLDGGVLITGKQFAKSIGFKDPHRALLKALNNDNDLFIKWSCFIKNIERYDGHHIQMPKNWQPDTIMINLAGVNTLLLKSKLPFAMDLKKWICKDVLPSISEHGHCTIKRDHYDDDHDDDQQPCTSKSVRRNSYCGGDQDPQLANYKSDCQKHEQEIQHLKDLNKELALSHKNELQRYDKKFKNTRQKHEKQIDKYEEDKKQLIKAHELELLRYDEHLDFLQRQVVMVNGTNNILNDDLRHLCSGILKKYT